MIVLAYKHYANEVEAFRSRVGRSKLVVYDAAHEREAKAEERLLDRVVLVRDEDLDCWDLLTGSQSVLLLVGEEHSRVLDFLEHEAFTRRVFSRENSYRDNMLESPESERRLAFQRLRFASTSDRVTRFLKGFGAQEMKRSDLAKDAEMEPAFGLIDWFFLGGVSTRARRRPSALRMSHWQKLWNPRLRWEVLTPRWSYWKGPISRTAAANPTSFVHVPKALEPVPPYTCWSCEFGDESLLQGFEMPAFSSYIVGKFRLVRLEELPCEWEAEFVLGCKAKQFVEICFAGGRIPYLYSVASDKILGYLRSIKPGDTVQNPCEWMRFGVAAQLFVPKDRVAEGDERRLEFASAGFTRFGRESFVPFPQMTSLQRYFARMREWLALYNNPPCSNSKSRSNRGTRVADGEDLSFRDEPVLRYLNIALTGFVQEKICGETVVNSAGHSVAVFVEHGQGFEAHTDASPPFDVTLDLVVGHTGNDHRPICLCPANSKGPIVVNCSFGESVVFRGGEISHYGNSLPEGNTHTVALLTWTFCRD